MNEYQVTIDVGSFIFSVDANNENEAIDKARELLSKEDLSYCEWWVAEVEMNVK